MKVQALQVEIKTLSLFFIVLAIGLFSCNDNYDEHYSYKKGEKSELNVFDFIKSKEELSTFANMLELSGYADTLSRAQSYTVFAPTNDALKNVDLTDVENLKRMVGNHLASHTLTTSTTLRGFNGKYLSLYKEEGKYFFFNKNTYATVTEANLLTKNGIVHILDKYLPYEFNIWEYIHGTAGMDSLSTFINSMNVTEFDREQSYDAGGVFIDSVFTTRNRIYNLGNINSENWAYTALLPTNEAWIKAYDKIFPFYRSLSKTTGGVTQTGIERQIERTKWAIVQDFLFHDYINVPTQRDSLISTSGTKFYTPDYLFQGTSKVLLSNGYGYVTNAMNNKIEDSWAKNIEEEAESNRYSLRLPSACDINLHSSLGTGITASNNAYIRLANLPNGNIPRASVTFPIPNILSGVKYNIYVVFIPANIDFPDEMCPYLVNIYLTHINASGRSQEFTLGSNMPTKTGEVTKLLVAENYEFPYCDLLETNDYRNEINVFLRIENIATTNQERAGEYSRKIGIDQIILESVIE